MARKIFNSMVKLAIVLVLISTFLTAGIFYKRFETQFIASLAGEASSVAAGVQLSGEEYLDALDGDDVRITWIDTDGTVLYDNQADASGMENHADREEVQEALEGDSGSSIRYSRTVGEKTVYYALRISDGTVIRLSGSYSGMMHMMIQIFILLVFVAGLAVFLALLIADRISKQIVKPLNMIDLDHPEETDTYEELVPMMRRIGQQNQRIREQMNELQRQQTEFSAITENMSEGFLVIDTKKNVLSYNSSALRMMGIPSVEENKNVLQVNRAEEFQQAVDEALEGKNSEQMLDISHRRYQLLANPVLQGEYVSGAVIVIMDVTEREQRESLRREFTANVSHELKTPLTSISGTAEIIMNGLVKQEDIPHFANNIYKEAQRLIALVGDIINLSQLEDTNMDDRKEMTDLETIVCNVTESLRLEAERRGISLEVQTVPCRIWGVPSVLDEIVYNLCDNAVKYNVEGGRVCVTVEKVGKRTQLSVKDTGIGISYEEQDRVFERFYRVDKSHSKAVGGTGLGLSIVKHGAAVHHAQLEMESEVGKGTEIRILF